MQVPAKKTVNLFIAISMVGLLLSNNVQGQTGKVIINEFNNSTNGCDGGAHFIELLNLGPGVQNISCYIVVTNGFTITIPNNDSAILNPGEIYVIAGVTQLLKCGSNSAPPVNVDLNWTSTSSCPNCITPSAPLMNAFFNSSNGSDSYPLALYDNNFNLIDAVRDPGSNLITGTARSNSIPTGSSCTSQTITLPSNIASYEQADPNSAGGNSSYSRASDGSCTWVKAAGNVTPGSPNSATSSFNTVTASSSLTPLCNSSSSANMAITINASTVPYQYSYVYATDANFTQNVTTSLITQSSSLSFTLSPINPGYYSFYSVFLTQVVEIAD
jgi:hypothetical protein